VSTRDPPQPTERTVWTFKHCAHPCSGTFLTNGARRRIAAVPVLDRRQDSRQMDLQGLGIGRGALGQRRHALCGGCIKPAIERGAGDAQPLTRKSRTQDISPVGPPGLPAKVLMARTTNPRFSLSYRSITPHCTPKPSLASWGSLASNTWRTSSPVMSAPSSIPDFPPSDSSEASRSRSTLGV
jgi:hypothetical protein